MLRISRMLRLSAPETTSVASAVPSAVMLAGGSTRDAERVHFPAVEAYVAELRAGLRGAGSAESVIATCEEVRQHLVASVRARLDLGAELETAETEAIRRFGGVAEHRVTLSREMRRTARRANPQTAFRYALALYGGVCALDLLGATFFAIAPQIEDARYHYLLDYGLWYAIFWLILGSPLVAGGIVGRQTRQLAIRATCRATPVVMGGLLLTSGLAYLLLLAMPSFWGEDLSAPSRQWPDSLTFGLACWYVIRFPISLISARLSGRTVRRSSPQVKG